jgi:hypothetical protein
LCRRRRYSILVAMCPSPMPRLARPNNYLH